VSAAVWIDSHCHVSSADFDEDREAVIQRALDDGVELLIGIGSGYGIEANLRAVELAAKHPHVYAAVGVHPHEAATLDDEGRRQLDGWLGRDRVVAVGECGLDYHYMRSPRDVQRSVFVEQLATARARSLPVSLHVRGEEPNAYEELLEIWQSEAGGELEGVLHCYTGTLDFARRALDAGLYVSFSGILTFKRDRGLREVAKALPLDRLMLETDAPLLAPEGFRGRRNEPARVALVGRVLAETRGISVEEVARATTRNARRLFRLPETGPSAGRS
jgi:TatD DNase family protein